MRRAVALGGVLLTWGLSLLAAGGQTLGANGGLVVERVRDNLYVLKGGGGNTAVFIGSQGVTVVDTKNPGWGQAILDAVRTLTAKPVIRIINTHAHGDHVSGNVEFPGAVDVVVQENTRANMARMRAASTDPPGTEGPTTQSFKDRMTIGAGPDQMDLYYFGRGHTDGDAWVVWPALHVMHAGDIFSGKVAPILDANNGGSGVEIGNSLARGARAVEHIDTVITGHGPEMTMADVLQYAEFNKDFLDYVRSASRVGKSVEAIASEYRLPAPYIGYTADQVRVGNNVRLIVEELKRP